MIQIFVENIDVDDVFATLTDLLTLPPTTPMVNQRINSNKNQSVQVQEDGNGNCLVKIVTVKAADPSQTKTFDNQSCSAGQTIDVDVVINSTK